MDGAFTLNARFVTDQSVYLGPAVSQVTIRWSDITISVVRPGTGMAVMAWLNKADLTRTGSGGIIFMGLYGGGKILLHSLTCQLYVV